VSERSERTPGERAPASRTVMGSGGAAPEKLVRLDRLLDELPEGPAVYAGDEVLTRDDLCARADAVATALKEIASGSPVAVKLLNGADLIATLFGVWKAGAVYVPVNPRLTPTEIDRIVEAVRPAAFIGDDSRAPAAQAPVHNDDIALIQFTSGTTGPPKPVLLRHSGVLTLLDGVIGTLRTRSADERRPPMPNLVPVSLSLWAGIYQVLFAFRVGAPVVVMERFETFAFADAVRRFGIRSTVLPPAAMTMLSDDMSIRDLAPLKYVRSISAPLSPLQARRFRDRFGIAVLNGYGQTELGGEIVGWTGADTKQFGDSKLGAVGRPHKGVSVRTDDAGELQVRTPAMSAGYANGVELSDRLTDDGWFRTGDIGHIDADGFVWIDGRVSDMINRGGLKVFPEEVAEVLRLSPSVADAAVAAMPDDRLGEVPCGFVVPAAGAPAVDVTALESLCREHLAPYKVPVRIEVVDELPRNEIGKVVLRDLGT
jgi:acyl-CoA synthetase (AMP-forming)/AMP-acid ligase II